MAEATQTDSDKKPTGATFTIEDAGPSLKKLKIDVPAGTIDERLGEAIDTIAAEAEIPGFRKGRVPRRLVEKKFAGLVADQAKGQIVSAAYQEAVDEHELKVIGEPTAEELAEVKVESGKPLSFEVEVEVMPTFDMPEIDGTEIFKPIIEVSDAQVEKEIEKICINEGDLEERDTPEAGDYITGTGIMTDAEGTEYYNIPGAVVRVPPKEDKGKGMILGVMIDDLEKQLGLPKPGETATATTKGPENHEREEIRGKDLTVTFAVDRVDRIIPKPLDQIVAGSGLESEDQIRQVIRQQLEQRIAVQQQTLLRRQVANHLLRNTEFELPQKLTARQAERTLQRRRMELLYRGVDQTAIEQHMAELRASSSALAARDLKLNFILHKAAEDLEVTVNDAEINTRIAQIAMQRGERPEQLRKQLIDANQVGSVYQQIREHKTMDALLAKAKIEELDSEAYNEKVRSLRGKGDDEESVEISEDPTAID